MTTMPTQSARHNTPGAISPLEVLRTQTGKGEDQSDAARVFYTLAANGLVPHDPRKMDQIRGGLAAAVATIEATVPMSAHRMRKAFAKMVEIFIGRGLLSPEDLDAILLAAVDFTEEEKKGAGASGR